MADVGLHILVTVPNHRDLTFSLFKLVSEFSLSNMSSTDKRFGVKTDIIPEEEIIKMLKDLEIKK